MRDKSVPWKWDILGSPRVIHSICEYEFERSDKAVSYVSTLTQPILALVVGAQVKFFFLRSTRFIGSFVRGDEGISFVSASARCKDRPAKVKPLNWTKLNWTIIRSVRNERTLIPNRKRVYAISSPSHPPEHHYTTPMTDGRVTPGGAFPFYCFAMMLCMNVCM